MKKSSTITYEVSLTFPAGQNGRSEILKNILLKSFPVSAESITEFTLNDETTLNVYLPTA